MLTEDQSRRLYASVSNLCELLQSGLDDQEPVEWLIQLFNGKADQLTKEESMPRGKKKTTTTQPAAPVAVTIPQDQTQLITEWHNAATELASIKAREHELRQALVAQMFDPAQLEGSFSVDIGWGYQLRVTKELNYTATNKEHETEALLAVLGPRSAELATTLVRWQPELSKSIARKVAELAQSDLELATALQKAVTIKPAMPQLEMVPPKTDSGAVPGPAIQPPAYQVEG